MVKSPLIGYNIMTGNFSTFVTNIGKYIASHFGETRNELMNGVTNVIAQSMYRDEISYEDMLGSLWLNYPDFTMELMNYMSNNDIDLKAEYQSYLQKKEKLKLKEIEQQKQLVKTIKEIYTTVYNVSNNAQYIDIDGRLIPKKWCKYEDGWGCCSGEWVIRNSDYKKDVADVYDILKHKIQAGTLGC